MQNELILHPDFPGFAYLLHDNSLNISNMRHIPSGIPLALYAYDQFQNSTEENLEGRPMMLMFAQRSDTFVLIEKSGEGIGAKSYLNTHLRRLT